MRRIPVVKAHAYGNDFLLVEQGSVPHDRTAIAQALCDRHRGVGADGLITYTLDGPRVTMHLLNADGSFSELSGNGLRCLAALAAERRRLQAGSQVDVDTSAGPKTLDLLGVDGVRYTFRAALGPPTDVHQEQIDVAGDTLTVSVLGMGNPQCVVLGPLPSTERFNQLGPALATHPRFPQGTNVEFAFVESPAVVRIVIWERGVGPTTSSGTGASASAVAAAAHGGATGDWVPWSECFTEIGRAHV